MAGSWSSFGATEYSKNCHGQFNWLHPTFIIKRSMKYWKISVTKLVAKKNVKSTVTWGITFKQTLGGPPSIHGKKSGARNVDGNLLGMT